MSFNNNKVLPALGMMTAVQESFTISNIVNLKFNDSNDSTLSSVAFQDVGSRSLVKLRFTRSDELEYNSVSVRIGESTDATRIGLIAGNHSADNNLHRTYSDNRACDTVDHVLNMAIVATNDNTESIDITDNTVLLIWRF